MSMQQSQSEMDKHITAYIGIGANLGEPVHTVRAAIEALTQLPRTQLCAQSSLYASAPVGEGADGPMYVNAVAQIQTELTAHQLLHALQAIEQQFGRVRSYRNAPRTLDLDVLLYTDQVIDTDHLTVPHPRMHERAFVLLPLVEVSPEISWHNAHGQIMRAQALLPQVAAQSIHRLETTD